MTDDITSALTPDEWEKREAKRGADVFDEVEVVGYDHLVVVRQAGESTCPTPARHALAALCLYQQPFGFTQEDVRFLERMARNTAYMPRIDQAHHASLASRISALLPPEQP